MPEMTDGGDKERTEELERELETWKERFEELSQKVCGGVVCGLCLCMWGGGGVVCGLCLCMWGGGCMVVSVWGGGVSVIISFSHTIFITDLLYRSFT